MQRSRGRAGDINRRRFLTGASSALGWGLAAPYVISIGACTGEPEVSEVPSALDFDSGRVFDLSVASGDPTATGVILWTRIRDSAFDPATVLHFQVATDAAFSALVLEGTVPAPATSAAVDYTVKVDLDGRLAAGRRYYYRFVYGNTASRTGRCQTLPAAGVAGVKLAVITCQDYTNGYYGAFHHIAADDSIDFVLHVGDFIYETVADARFQGQPFADRQLALPSGGAASLGLSDYRFLYRTYRSDPALQRALEQHTSILAPDDHETANDCYWDYARDTLGAPDHPFKDDAAKLKRLKLDSQQAWLEYVPARVPFDPTATHPHQQKPVYREFAFGDLVRLCMLDTRTYRTPHPCGEADFFHRYLPVGCTNLNAPAQSLLGPDQRTWLVDRLSASGALWKLVGNQTYMGRLSALPFGGLPIDVDAWDGYAAERVWLARELKKRAVKNLVLVTGDLHSTIASHVLVDYSDINPFDTGNVVGVELMTPAVTSASLFESLTRGLGQSGSGQSAIGDGLAAAAVRVNNPHISFFNSSRYGYSTVRFSRTECEWIAYAVDKSASDPSTSSRQAMARFRKTPSWPFLIEGSTAGL